MFIGVVYVATGKQRYIDEACISASSLKKHMPDLPITLFSDQAVTISCFDECRTIESSGSGILDKALGMQQSPYDYTLFLDTDTYVCSDFLELFTLLDKYDIAAVLNEHRTGTFEDLRWDYQCIKNDEGKLIYPMYNSGVILYKKSPEISQFFSNWIALTKQRDYKGKITDDQISFQHTLYSSNLRTVVLPPEYNCRFTYPLGVCGTVKILHGRHKNLAAIAREINRETNPRVFHPRWGLISNSGTLMIKRIGQSTVKEKLNLDPF
jgi:hypothetical protein